MLSASRLCKGVDEGASCNYSCSNSCKILHHFLQDMCKIVQESCKKRDISRAHAKQVLHARFLHDLASSFLLGCSTAQF